MIRLASLPNGTRDGRLVVVGADHGTFLAPSEEISVLAALERWDEVRPRLDELAERLAHGEGDRLDVGSLLAPLPRTFQYCEGSTYLSHMERGRRARNAELPPGHGAEPAVLQSHSDRFLAPTEPIELGDVAWDLDFEATVAVVLADTPAGVSVADAPAYVRLVVLLDDLTLRSILPGEFYKGVGFVQAKPRRAFAPIAVAPEVLGADWNGRMLHATVRSWVNDELIGTLNSGIDAAFDFAEIIAYCARTRPLSAGTIVSTGTISNRDDTVGFGCLVERRAMQAIAGEPLSPYLRPGDRLRIEASDADGRSIFGAMDASVVARGEVPEATRAAAQPGGTVTEHQLSGDGSR